MVKNFVSFLDEQEAGLLPYGLAAGDQVVLLPIEEKQRYIILCKAVKV